MMGIVFFILGCLVGIFITFVIGIYFLMKHDKPNDQQIQPNETQNKFKENEPTIEETQVLNDALKVLRGEVDETPAPELHPSEEQAPTEIREMEEAFKVASQESKKRQKHLKALTSFFQEYSQIYSQLSKDLKRLSMVAQGQASENTIIDKWWNAMSVALEHLSKDEGLLRKSINDDILHPMTRIELEHSHLEKQLNAEGLKLLTKLKESQQYYDLKLKEHEKYREKISSNSCLTTSSDQGSPPKTISRTHPIEVALDEAGDKLAGAQQGFNEKMPRILKDYKLITSNCVSASMERLLQLSDVLSAPLEKVAQIIHRLKMDLASSAMQSTDRCNYNPVVLKLLENISKQTPKNYLDMTLESSAGLAASSLHALPHLPPQFGDSIQKETCIWFNALSGRMYRDAARSEGFHNWFCTKASHLLNKGKKTPLFDKYTVSNPCFGSTPPLLLNVQWAPSTKQSSSSGAPSQDSEYDVECTADIAFRSSMKFTVSTKLWINWPREKCAHIPISIVLELSELSGRIRFGVRKHSSFLSFVEEPYTRFNVTSEVGDQYKLKNIPKVSSLIINKLKKHIRTKLIYPGSFKLRLIWPRKWWPPGGEHLFKSETKETETAAPIPTQIPSVIGAEKSQTIPSLQGTDFALSPPRTPSKTVTVDEVLSAANSEQETLLQRWFWNTASTTTGAAAASSRSVKAPPRSSANDLLGPPGTLRMVARRRQSSDPSLTSFSTPVRSGSVAHPDHVRLYVSDLLSENDTITNPYYANRLAADDMLVIEKSSIGATDSVAIMRSRSHSISDFRHPTLESMWSGFLGSIGHDFSLLLDQNKAAATANGTKSIKKDNTVREFRLFSIQLSSFRKKRRTQKKMNPMKSNQLASNAPPVPPRQSQPTVTGGFAGFGFNFLGGALSPSPNPTPSPTHAIVRTAKRNLLREIDQLDISTSSTASCYSSASTSASTSASAHGYASGSALAPMDQLYSNKLGRVVDILSSSKSTNHSNSNNQSTTSASTDSDMNIPSRTSSRGNGDDDLEQDAVNFAWQAQAEAITQAASRGEHLNMQNFLKTPKAVSPKSWVVMKDGNLTIYPNPNANPNATISAETILEKNQPTGTYKLRGCICRPLDHHKGFEVGFVVNSNNKDSKDGKSTIEWVRFWTESNIQCRAWIMALQHSANFSCHKDQYEICL